MPVPKRRHSTTRRDKRRANDALKAGSTNPCSQCGEPKLPHRVCRHCGFYNGRQITEIKEE